MVVVVATKPAVVVRKRLLPLLSVIYEILSVRYSSCLPLLATERCRASAGSLVELDKVLEGTVFCESTHIVQFGC